MNHPRIETRDLSDEVIRRIMDVLMEDYYRLKDSEDAAGRKMAEAAKEMSNRIQRFLDR